MTELKLFPETLPDKTAKLVKDFQEKPSGFLNTFYLSGGTALSLQLGHRESEDLDFFSQDSFSVTKLQRELMEYGDLKNTELGEGTVNTFLAGVQLQFLEYPYNLIQPKVKWQNIELSSMEDIACTKLQTVGMRGSKKDFVDLYFLLDKFSLAELFKLMQEKYRKINYSKTHIMKSLVYFADAQRQPMPRMHQEVSWERVKEKMIEVVKGVRFV